MPWASPKPQPIKTANTSHDNLNTAVVPSKRPNTSHLVPTEVRDYLSEVARSRSVGNFSPPADRIEPRNVAPKSGCRQPSRSALLSTPSPTHENSSRVSRGKDRVKKVTPRKVKVKRSIQEIFRKRDIKPDDSCVNRTVSKRSSNAGSTFAQRIKDSTAFSKNNPSRSLDPASEAQQNIASERGEPLEGDRNMALSALEAGSSSTVPSPPVQGLTDTAKVINNIVDRVTSMEMSSPDRLRGVEIAEVCDKVCPLEFELALTRSLK
jgi:hypothetical protein